MPVPSTYRDALPFMVRNYARQFGVTIEVKGAHAYSTRHSIVIPELDLSDPTLARLTYGFLAHEAGHLRYSDFALCSKLKNEVLLRIVNSLEDGRIEYLMARNFVGVYENLELLNQCLMRDNHQLLLQGHSWSKIDLLTTALVLLSHERFNNYPGVAILRRDYLNELSCLMNEADLHEIVALTYRLPNCHSTRDIIELAYEIYDIMQRPTCFVPNFTRFALRYQCTSRYDLQNCRRLAAAYGQTFSAPVICPYPELKLKTAQDLVAAAGIDAELSELNEDYVPNFLSPREPSFMPQSNSAALLARVGNAQLSHAQELSDSSAGNDAESARLFAKNRSLRAQSAENLGRALNELMPSISTSSREGQAVRAALKARQTKSELPPKEGAPFELTALGHALSFNPASYDVYLALGAQEAVPFFGVSAQPSPYQGPYASCGEWAQALSVGQIKAQDQVGRRHEHLPEHWATLESELNQSAPSEELYWRLKQRDLAPIAASAHLTGEEVSKLGLSRVTPSLELCTRLILNAWADPSLEQPLLPWLELRNLPPQFKELMFLALSAQDERIQKLKALRAPIAGLIATPAECAMQTQHALQVCADFFQGSLNCTSLSRAITNSNAVRAQRGLWPVIQLTQEPLELATLDWGNAPQQASSLPPELLHGDSATMATPVLDVAEHLGPFFKQYLLQRRREVKFQRTEAILSELGLLNSKSLDVAPSLNLATYCYDPASGQSYTYDLLLRRLVAQRALLHNCPTTIAPTVHPNHYLGLINAQGKHGSQHGTQHGSQHGAQHGTQYGSQHGAQYGSQHGAQLSASKDVPVDFTQPKGQLELLPQDRAGLTERLQALYKNPQLSCWDDAPAAFNAAIPALGEPTKVEVLQMLLSALPEPVSCEQQEQFMLWLKHQTKATSWSHQRDPRLECTLTDALREFWYVRSDYCPEQDVPATEPCAVLERMAQRQGISESWQGGLVVCPHPQQDPSAELIPSYYQLDLKQFVAQIKRKYDPLRRKLRQRLQSYLECQQEYGKSGRRLDVRRAAKLCVGETRIFKQRSYLADESTALHLLVDCSGSMGQCATNQGNATRLEDTRIYQACAAALTLGLALDHLSGLELMITFFPHTLEDQPYFNVIAKGEHVSAHPERLWHPPYGGTPMDQALNYAAESVLRCNATRSIVVVLTDGQPNKPEALINEVRKAQDCGIEVYGIGINESEGHKYFDHFYDLTDFSNLTYELCTLVSQVFKLPEVA